jgi:D-arginine dehydrogenase
VDTAADILVIGAGIAGASVADALAPSARVIVLEQEERPGMHSTGRSAALFSETYGNEVIRSLSRASRAFLASPPPGFCETPLIRPRGTLYIAADDQLDQLRALEVDAGTFERLSGAEARRRVPILRPDSSAAALYESGAMDIDVDALHQGFLRRLRRAGGQVITEARVTALSWSAGRWTASTTQGDFSAPIVINAAGAWADRIAAIAGLAPLGLQPKRRTAALIDGPADLDFSGWPLVIDAGETVYFKPDAGRLLISPADETDTEPGDAQPDDLDVAIAVDRLEHMTTLSVRRIAHRWAGLRTFAPDRTPVCGYDPRTEGFFWLAGQGGYGIQTSPALARLAARLVLRTPGDLAELETALGPDRFAPA